MPPDDAPPAPPPAAPAAAPQPVPPIPPLDVAGIVAEELKLPPASVARTLELIAGGATVPFMARYRKEVTGGLDEVQLGAIKQRAEELAELDSRRKTVIESIAGQGKLTDELLRPAAVHPVADRAGGPVPALQAQAADAGDDRPRAGAGAAGGHPVGAGAVAGRDRGEALAAPFVSAEKEVADAEAAWAGARDIVAERIADSADARAALRAQVLADGMHAQPAGQSGESRQ